MKKLLLSVIVLLLVLSVTAQTPSGKTPIGSPLLTQWNKGVQLADSGYQFTNFVDTIHLNYGWLKGIPGLLVRVADTTFYVRNNAMTKWVKVGGSGASTDSTIFITHTVLNDSVVALNTRLADTSALLRNLINSFASDTTLIGDVIGGLRSNTVTGLRGKVLPSLSAGYLMYNGTSWVMASVSGGITALTGDITASGTGSVVATLPNVNSTPGIFGTPAVVAAITTNAKGQITGTVSDSIQITESHVTGLISDLAGKQNLLGFTPENIANKVTAFGTINNTLYPTTQAVANYLTANAYPLSSNPASYLTTINGITASGDLSGTYAGPEVVGLLGQGLPSLSNGYLVYNSMTGWQLNNITPVGLSKYQIDSTNTANAIALKKNISDTVLGTGYKTRNSAQNDSIALATAIATKGSGTVTSITAGTDLTGGTITSTGTIAADTSIGNTKLATQGFVARQGYGTGTVTSVASANGDATVATTTTTPVITINTGTGANQIPKRDGSGNLAATTVTTNANLTGDITSSGNTTTYNNIVPIVKGGTGTSTPSLVAGSNVTITGSWPNQTVASTGSGGITTTTNVSTSPTGISGSNLNVNDTTKSNKLYFVGQIAALGSFTSLAASNLIDSGANATVRNSTIIMKPISPASNNFGAVLGYNYPTVSDQQTITAYFTVPPKTSTSYGGGVCLQSLLPTDPACLYLKLDMSNAGSSGALTLIAGNTNTLVATAPTNMTITAGHVVCITLNIQGIVASGYAYDTTAKTAKVQIPNYSFSFAYPFVIQRYNTSRPSVFCQGDSLQLDSFSLVSNVIKYNTVAMIGSSKTLGNGGGNDNAGSYSGIICRAFGGDIFAGGGDLTANIINRLPEVIAAHPKYVIMGGDVVRNDQLQNFSSSVYLANYDTIVNRLTAAGIKVYHMLPIYDTGVATQAIIGNHIISTYPGLYYDSKGQLMAATATNVTSPDLLHPNPWYDYFIGTGFVHSGLINSAFIPPIPYNTVPTTWTTDNVGNSTTTDAVNVGSGVGSTNQFSIFAGSGIYEKHFSFGGVMYTTGVTALSGGTGYPLGWAGGSGSVISLYNVAGVWPWGTLTGSNPNATMTLASTANFAKLQLTSGSNTSTDTAILVNGTVTINNTAVTSKSRIWVSYQNGTTQSLGAGLVSVTFTIPTITPSTSFVITALTSAGITNTTDNSKIQYWIYN